MTSTIIDVEAEDPIEGEEVKEIYALFGAAYYFSEVLHRGLCNLYTVAPFDTRAGITASIFEQRITSAYKMTLGEVASAVEPWIETTFRDHLRSVVKRRNYLAHHFWFERIMLMRTRAGLAELAQELHELRDLFGTTDEVVSGMCAEKHKRLGMPDDAIEQALAEMEAGIPHESLEQRRLASEEMIVKAWDVTSGDGGIASIFELADGTFWQLGDQGLSWTKHRTVGPDWSENAVLKKYLPAKTKPLPGKPGSWDYEFTLKGAKLWVKLDPSLNKLRWGTRPTKRDHKKG